METVLVQVPSPDGGPPSQVLHVRPGETLRFGRGADGCGVEVVLDHDGVSRQGVSIMRARFLSSAIVALGPRRRALVRLGSRVGAGHLRRR
jgi:hypothetical protein